MHSQMTFELATRLNNSSRLVCYRYYDRDMVSIHVIREGRHCFDWEIIQVSYALFKYIVGVTTKLVIVNVQNYNDQ